MSKDASTKIGFDLPMIRFQPDAAALRTEDRLFVNTNVVDNSPAISLLSNVTMPEQPDLINEVRTDLKRLTLSNYE